MGPVGDNGFPPPPRKLYVVVRGDLAPGLRAAQAGHAVADTILEFPEQAKLWRTTDNYLIVLQVPNKQLLTINHAHLYAQMPTKMFFEPDLGDEPTAFAALPHPDQNQCFAHLDLAYSSWVSRLRSFIPRGS